MTTKAGATAPSVKPSCKVKALGSEGTREVYGETHEETDGHHSAKVLRCCLTADDDGPDHDGDGDEGADRELVKEVKDREFGDKLAEIWKERKDQGRQGGT